MMSTRGRVGVPNPYVVHLKLNSRCVLANWNVNKSLRKGSRTPPPTAPKQQLWVCTLDHIWGTTVLKQML